MVVPRHRRVVGRWENFLNGSNSLFAPFPQVACVRVFVAGHAQPQSGALPLNDFRHFVFGIRESINEKKACS
jgi:hypothetical protein